MRRGHALRLIIPGKSDAGAAPILTNCDPKLAALLAEAMDARALVLGLPDRTLQAIAAEHDRCRKRLARLVKLSWLAPAIVPTSQTDEQSI